LLASAQFQIDEDAPFRESLWTFDLSFSRSTDIMLCVGFQPYNNDVEVSLALLGEVDFRRYHSDHPGRVCRRTPKDFDILGAQL
jgi:hypothetical protein